MYYENQSKNKTFSVTTQLLNMQGIKFKKPDRRDQFEVNIGPGESRIAIATISQDGWQAKVSETNLSIK